MVSQATGPAWTGVVLVVDDEAVMRQFCSRVLREDGHVVLEAAGAAEAFAILTTRGPEIDVVVTDVMIPGLCLHELVSRARAEHPRIRIILMSGYGQRELMAMGIAPDCFRFLHKPFTIVDLSRAVRAMAP